MRASEHFYTELEGIARKANAEPSSAEHAFYRLTAPIVGEAAAEELFRFWEERHAAAGAIDWPKLGHLASFILGDYDDATMDLNKDDWAAVRDIMSAEAEEMNLEDLTRIMADLVSRGALD